MLTGEPRLEIAGLGDPQVVEAELPGQIRLPVPRVQGMALGHDVPLREATTMPGVVLGDVVELGQVEGEDVRSLLVVTARC